MQLDGVQEEDGEEEGEEQEEEREEETAGIQVP